MKAFKEMLSVCLMAYSAAFILVLMVALTTGKVWLMPFDIMVMGICLIISFGASVSALTLQYTE